MQCIQHDFPTAQCDTNTTQLSSNSVLCASPKDNREHKIAHRTDKYKYFPIKCFQCIYRTILYAILRNHDYSTTQGTREKQKQEQQSKKASLFSEGNSEHEYCDSDLCAKIAKRSENRQTA